MTTKRKHTKIQMLDTKVYGRRVATIEVQLKNGHRVHIPRAWVEDEAPRKATK